MKQIRPVHIIIIYTLHIETATRAARLPKSGCTPPITWKHGRKRSIISKPTGVLTTAPEQKAENRTQQSRRWELKCTLQNSRGRRGSWNKQDCVYAITHSGKCTSLYEVCGRAKNIQFSCRNCRPVCNRGFNGALTKMAAFMTFLLLITANIRLQL